MTDADRATQTLREICIKKTLRTMTRADVDDIFWSIRQLNERNHLIAEVLAKNENAVLDAADVKVLEDSVSAVRQLYSWVARTRHEADVLRGITPYTLQQIANEYNCTLRALRHVNHELDHLKADDDIPRGHHVRIPKASHETKAAITLERIARQHKVTLSKLRHFNPHLNRYADDEPLPRKIEVQIPSQAMRQDPLRGRDVEPGEIYVTQGNESIRFLAHEVFRCTVPQVRTQGGNRRQLNEFSDVDILPPGIEVEVPEDLRPDDEEKEIVMIAPHKQRSHARLSPRHTQRDDYFEDDFDDEEYEPNGRHQTARGHNYSDNYGFDDEEPAYITNGHETVAEIASRFGVSPKEIITANRVLLQIRRYERVPKGIEIFAP